MLEGTERGPWGQTLRHLRIPCRRFIGRDGELLWLQERLEEAYRGQGELVFLAGEAGVGKSRLLGELTVRGQQAEIRILEGRCSLFEAALPYAPFVEAFRGLLHARTPSEIGALLGSYAPEVMRLLPELAQLLPGLQPNPPLSPPQEKSRLFESLYQVFRRVAGEAPLILGLEDVHWADPASLELLYFFARRLRRDRWLVLATYRPEELPRAEGLGELRQDLLRGRLAQELTISPLSAAETGKLLKEVLEEPARIPEALSDWIFHYGEGNPFFTEEILRTIIEASDEPIVNLDPATMSAVAVPATVRETILRRLEHLTVEARDILAAAAVLGRSFDLKDLQEASALAGEAFSRPFLSLLSQQLIRPDRAPLRYGFRHHLIREVVVQSLAPDVRRRLHQRVGELLEARGSPVVTQRILAHHFHEAGDRDRTVRYASAAASEASAVYAHEDAAQYLTLALAGLPASATLTQLEISEALGDAWLHARRYGRALEAFTVMLECARTLDMRPEMARAYRKTGVMQNQQASGTGFAAWDAGLAVLHGIDAPSEEAMISAELSCAASNAGQFERGATHGRAGVAAAVRAGKPSVLSRCYVALGFNLYLQGHNAEARECIEKAVALARHANDLEAELPALVNAACYALEDADFSYAREALERACALADKVGGVKGAFYPVLNLAELSLLEGKWEDAESLSTKLVTQLEEMRRPEPFGFAARDLACAHLLRGRFEEAEALLHEARSWAESTSDAYTLMYVLTGLAQVDLGRRNAPFAKAWLERALALSAKSGYAGAAIAEALLMLTEVSVLLGDAAEARVCLQKAVAAAEPYRYLIPWVFRVRGQVAIQGGSFDEAVVDYQAGLDAVAAAPQPYQEALLRYHLGMCLQRRNRPGDHRAARGHLNDALASLQRLGARPDIEIVQHALSRIRGRVPAGHALTKREQEVRDLLAEGLNNAAIAGRLYLSERTVEVHVSHILDKLGLESRTQVAAWVAKHGVNPLPAKSVD